MDKLTDMQKDILVQIASAPGGYLPEWNLRQRAERDLEFVSTSVIGGAVPTLYVMRDMGLIEELPDLHERWQLTIPGWRAAHAETLKRLREAEEQAPAPATDTVADLRRALEGLDGEMRVVLSRDAEGNGYSPFADAAVMYYSPSVGEVCDQDEMAEYGQHDSRPALVLWPVG